MCMEYVACVCADLEYPIENNKDTDGNQLVDTLLDLCSAALKASLISVRALRVGSVYGAARSVLCCCSSNIACNLQAWSKI